jgi:bifunctional non-homologous end joining protein LigD
MDMAEQQSDEVLVEVDGRKLPLSNLDKVLYPATGFTKGEVIDYYTRIAPVLLPHLADRAVTRIRWPNGTADNPFFEKNLPSGAPGWLRSVTVPSSGSRGGGDTITYPVIDDLATLTYLVNLGSLELHVHQWRVGANNQPKNPDRLVVDLDPGAPAGLHECCRVALLVRDRLADLGLSSAPVTSGSSTGAICA